MIILIIGGSETERRIDLFDWSKKSSVCNMSLRTIETYRMYRPFRKMIEAMVCSCVEWHVEKYCDKIC